MFAAKHAFILIGIATLAGCGPIQSPIAVEVVTSEADHIDQYRLSTAVLHSVTDVKTLSGMNFQFVGDVSVDLNLFPMFARQFQNFDDFKKAIRSRSGGVSVQPRLFWDGNVWRSQDYHSLMMTTAFFHLEKTWQFARQVVNDDSRAVSEPTILAIYGDITSNAQLPFPIATSDNAAYLPGADIWYLLRVGDQTGLPFAMNAGVVAHEFHHRIFFYRVWVNQGEAAYKRWAEQLSRPKQVKPERGTILIKATDEGLSDIFAVGLTGSPAFLNPTLTENDLGFRRVRLQRDLEGKFANEATYDNLADSSISNELLQLCKEPSYDFSNRNWNFYCLGTVLARTLWDASGKNIRVLTTEILPAVNKSLDDVGAALAQGKQYDLDILLQGIAGRLKDNAQLCQQISVRFKSLYSAKRISACSGG